MFGFYTFRYIIFLPIFALLFSIVAADYSRSSFYFKNFSKDSDFESQLNLYGDSKVVNDSLCVEITGSWFNSAGRIVFKKPFRLLEGTPSSLVSFSTYFSFSMSRDGGDGLAFFMVPVGFDLNEFDGGSFGLLGEKKMRFLSVEFDTFKARKYGDLDDNHVGIDVDSFVSVRVSNVSFMNLVSNNGEKLQAWIDYEASSKKLEVRMSKLGNGRPVDPLLSYSIDVSKVWKEDEVFVGLSSSNGNSSQKSNVCSWSFKARQAPHWMHSEPLDPERTVVEKTKVVTLHKRSDCFLKVLAALIVGTACGALGTFFVLFVWTISGASKRSVVPVLPEQYVVHPEEFEYNKFKVVVQKLGFTKNPKMACTVDLRFLDEGFGGKTAKRKRAEQEHLNHLLHLSQQNQNDDVSMEIDINEPPPAAKRQAVPSSDDPNKPVYGNPTYDGVIAGKVSGRKWKQVRTHRSSATKVSLRGTTFEQRAKQKEIKKAYKEKMNELKEEIRMHKVEKRKHKEEKDKRKQENIIRTGSKLQIISNPKTLKKIQKSKQRKLLKVVPDHLVKKSN